MKKYLVAFCIYSLLALLTCTDTIPTWQFPEVPEGESYPEGPLRTIDSKIKKEKIYHYNSMQLLEETAYEYYGNGLLKSKFHSLNGYKHVNTFYYDTGFKLIREIIQEGDIYTDSINYKYGADNLLLWKETVHVAPQFSIRDTVFYKYDSNGNLTEWYRKNPYDDYKTLMSEKNEYLNGLLIKTQSYHNGSLVRTYEYEYYNNIKTKLSVYSSSGICISRTIYYYEDRLLKIEKGLYLGDSKYIDLVVYEYNNKYELILKTVLPPLYSSYVSHIINYEYN